MSDDKKGKLAIIGDPDILLIFKLIGVEVYPARNESEARQALKEVEAEPFPLVLIQQNYYFLLSEKEKKKEPWPVFLPFRDYRQEGDLVEEEIKRMMIRAIGSDTLLRKGS